MIRWITYYTAATGAVGEQALIEEGDEDWRLGPDDAWIEGAWSDGAHRIDVTDPDRPAVPLLQFNVTVSDYRIDGIPPGTVAWIDGERVSVDDGFIEFDLELELEQNVEAMLTNPIYETVELVVPCPAS